MNNFTDRALREQAQLDGDGLNRSFFRKFFSHTRHYYALRREEILRQELQYANGRRILEIGSQCWFQWMEGLQVKPHTLSCVNISARALEQGEQKARQARLKPRFFLMDAHKLDFEDNSFDIVYGDAILHHLDLISALNEIERVLSPGGRIIFCEPLGMNPVGNIVRWFTPEARTEDEHPLTSKDMAEIEKRFQAKFYYEQFLSVPFGVVSKMLFSSPANKLMKSAFALDKLIDSSFSPARNLFRSIIITGKSRKKVTEAAGVTELRNVS